MDFSGQMLGHRTASEFYYERWCVFGDYVISVIECLFYFPAEKPRGRPANAIGFSSLFGNRSSSFSSTLPFLLT